jgi:hypothetical protein
MINNTDLPDGWVMPDDLAKKVCEALTIKSITPDDELKDSLDKVRSYMVDILPGMAGSKLVIGIDREFWSPRKLLRRAVWHERDHTFHIRKLLKL